MGGAGHLHMWDLVYKFLHAFDPSRDKVNNHSFVFILTTHSFFWPSKDSLFSFRIFILKDLE